MQEIPGSAPRDARSAPVDKTNKPLPAWAAVGRWVARYGEGNKPEPFTPAHARGVRNKRLGALVGADGTPSTFNPLPLEQCLTGARLLAGLRSGKLWPVPLTRRGVKLAPPSEALQAKVVGAKWRLRGSYLELLCLIAIAEVACGLVGTVIKQDELGQACELAAYRRLQERRVREVLHTLRRWGLVKATPTQVELGAVSSQRESIYQLTDLAYATFGLPPPAGRTPPEPEQGVAPRIARARQTGMKMPSNPENTVVQVTEVEQSAHPGGGGAGAVVWGVAPAKPATLDFRTVEADESPLPSLPETREGENCDPVGRFVEAESTEPSLDALAGGERELVGPSIFGGILDRARRGEIVDDAERNRRRGWRERIERRRRADEEVVAELELDRVMVRGAKLDVAGDAHPNAPAADEEDAAELERARAEERARYREQLDADRRARQNGRVERRESVIATDEEIASMNTELLSSWEKALSRRLARTAGRKGRAGGDS